MIDDVLQLDFGIENVYDLKLNAFHYHTLIRLNRYEAFVATPKEIIRFENMVEKKRYPLKSCACLYSDQHDALVLVTPVNSEFQVYFLNDMKKPQLTGVKLDQVGVNHMFYSAKSKTIITIGIGIKTWNFDCELASARLMSQDKSVKIEQRASFAHAYNSKMLSPPVYDEENDIIITYTDSGLVSYSLDGKVLPSLTNSASGRITMFALNPVNRKMMTCDYNFGICYWDKNGRLIKRFGINNFSIVAGFFANNEFFICVDINFNVHIIDVKTYRNFTEFKLPQRPQKILFEKLSNQPPQMIIINETSITFYQIKLPWSLWTSTKTTPVEIKRCPMENKAARLAVKLSDSSIQLFSPKTKQILSICHSSITSFPKCAHVDRGIINVFTRDQLYVLYDNGYAEIFLCNSNPCEPSATLNLKSNCSLTCKVNGQWVILFGARTGEVLIYSYEELKFLRKIPLTAEPVLGLLQHEKSGSIFAVLSRRLVRIGTEDGGQKKEYNLISSDVMAIYDDLLIVCYENGTMIINKINEDLSFDRILSDTRPQHGGPISAITRGQTFFVTVALDGSVLIWNMNAEILVMCHFPIKIFSCCVLNGNRSILLGTETEIMILETKCVFGKEIDREDPVLDNFDRKKDDLSFNYELFRKKHAHEEEEEEEYNLYDMNGENTDTNTNATSAKMKKTGKLNYSNFQRNPNDPKDLLNQLSSRKQLEIDEAERQKKIKEMMAIQNESERRANHKDVDLVDKNVEAKDENENDDNNDNEIELVSSEYDEDEEDICSKYMSQEDLEKAIHEELLSKSDDNVSGMDGSDSSDQNGSDKDNLGDSILNDKNKNKDDDKTNQGLSSSSVNGNSGNKVLNVKPPTSTVNQNKFKPQRSGQGTSHDNRNSTNKSGNKGGSKDDDDASKKGGGGKKKKSENSVKTHILNIENQDDKDKVANGGAKDLNKEGSKGKLSKSGLLGEILGSDSNGKSKGGDKENNKKTKRGDKKGMTMNKKKKGTNKNNAEANKMFERMNKKNATNQNGDGNEKSETVKYYRKPKRAPTPTTDYLRVMKKIPRYFKHKKKDKFKVPPDFDLMNLKDLPTFLIYDQAAIMEQFGNRCPELIDQFKKLISYNPDVVCVANEELEDEQEADQELNPATKNFKHNERYYNKKLPEPQSYQKAQRRKALKPSGSILDKIVHPEKRKDYHPPSPNDEFDEENGSIFMFHGKKCRAVTCTTPKKLRNSNSEIKNYERINQRKCSTSHQSVTKTKATEEELWRSIYTDFFGSDMDDLPKDNKGKKKVKRYYRPIYKEKDPDYVLDDEEESNFPATRKEHNQRTRKYGSNRETSDSNDEGEQAIQRYRKISKQARKNDSNRESSDNDDEQVTPRYKKIPRPNRKYGSNRESSDEDDQTTPRYQKTPRPNKKFVSNRESSDSNDEDEQVTQRYQKIPNQIRKQKINQGQYESDEDEQMSPRYQKVRKQDRKHGLNKDQNIPDQYEQYEDENQINPKYKRIPRPVKKQGESGSYEGEQGQDPVLYNKNVKPNQRRPANGDESSETNNDEMQNDNVNQYPKKILPKNANPRWKVYSKYGQMPMQKPQEGFNGYVGGEEIINKNGESGSHLPALHRKDGEIANDMKEEEQKTPKVPKLPPLNQISGGTGQYSGVHCKGGKVYDSSGELIDHAYYSYSSSRTSSVANTLSNPGSRPNEFLTPRKPVYYHKKRTGKPYMTIDYFHVSRCNGAGMIGSSRNPNVASVRPKKQNLRDLSAIFKPFK